MMYIKLSLEELNSLSPAEFHVIFRNVIEGWPEAAAFCAAMLPFKSIEALCNTFINYVEKLDQETKFRVLRQYPDLAGKLLDMDELTDESCYEHACAGLDKLSIENRDKLTDLNERYKAKFNFPFVICVREAAKFPIILKAVTKRIDNTPEQEIKAGMEEVKKICTLRILELVDKY